MKNIYTFIFIIMVSLLMTITPCFALEVSDIHSKEALLINLKTDEIIFNKKTENKPVPIASLTKLMTYLLAVENIDDLEHTMIKVPDGLAEQMKKRNASRAGILDGYEYSALDLLYGMMLPSGCDAAQTIAYYLGDGDHDAFTLKMNQRAKELGMNDTTYIDAHGIGTEVDNMSTVEDQYILIKLLTTKPMFKEIISKEYRVMTGYNGDKTDQIAVRNTNYTVGEYKGGQYYYPYSIGGKTGSLNVAGKCLATIAVKGDLEVLALTLGVPGQASSSYDYHLTDNIKLLSYAFDTLTENITIDIGPEFRSMKSGQKIKIEASTSSDTEITWESSNPDIATVDKNGIVKGLRMGMTKITAKTKTGNIDYTFVSVDFYNGINTKWSTGPSIGTNNWGPIDWDVVINKGYDYVVIRAAIGSSSKDNTFEENISSALSKKMNVGIWQEGYANSVDVANLEADNMLNILNGRFNDDSLSIPIVYSLLNSDATDPEVLESIALTYASKLQAKGYKVIFELQKNKLATMNLEKLREKNIGISIIYRAIIPDFTVKMDASSDTADIWNYKTDVYIANEGVGKNAVQTLIYMDAMTLNTNINELDLADFTSLDEMLKKAENLAKTKNTYTSKTINNLKSTIKDVLKYKSENVVVYCDEQNIVDSYTSKLKTAISGLQKIVKKASVSTKKVENAKVEEEVLQEVVDDKKEEVVEPEKKEEPSKIEEKIIIPKEEEKKDNNNYLLFIIIFVILIIGLLLFAIFKRRKKEDE